MLKYAVWGNEKMTPLQVAEQLELPLEECIMCPDGEKEADNYVTVDGDLIIVGPTRECDICHGISNELTVCHQPGSIVGDGNFLICPYCSNSTGGIVYNYDSIKQDLMRHINSMFNLFEHRMKDYLNHQGG